MQNAEAKWWTEERRHKATTGTRHGGIHLILAVLRKNDHWPLEHWVGPQVGTRSQQAQAAVGHPNQIAKHCTANLHKCQ